MRASDCRENTWFFSTSANTIQADSNSSHRPSCHAGQGFEGGENQHARRHHPLRHSEGDLPRGLHHAAHTFRQHHQGEAGQHDRRAPRSLQLDLYAVQGRVSTPDSDDHESPGWGSCTDRGSEWQVRLLSFCVYYCEQRINPSNFEFEFEPQSCFAPIAGGCHAPQPHLTQPGDSTDMSVNSLR